MLRCSWLLKYVGSVLYRWFDGLCSSDQTRCLVWLRVVVISLYCAPSAFETFMRWSVGGSTCEFRMSASFNLGLL
jgi:hypothetical protein